jgi:hypothetical protein
MEIKAARDLDSPANLAIVQMQSLPEKLVSGLAKEIGASMLHHRTDAIDARPNAQQSMRFSLAAIINDRDSEVIELAQS